LLANALGVSGLVAVAGLYFGNITILKETVVSENVRKSAFHFWEIIAFFAISAIWPMDFANYQQAETAVKEAFTDYNQYRIHSSLGYLTPHEFIASLTKVTNNA